MHDGDEDIIWLRRLDVVEPTPDRRGSALRPGRWALTCALAAAAVCGGVQRPGPSASIVSPAMARTSAVPDVPAPGRDAIAAAVASVAVAAPALPAGPATAELERVADAPGNPEEVLRFGPMRVRRGIVETIVRAARVTGSDPALLMAIADKESSFAPAVRARTSSAEGLFQFIERTWLATVRLHGAGHGMAAEAAAIADDGVGGWSVGDPSERARILGLRRDPYLAAVMAAEMLKADASRIAATIGRELTHGEIYIAHFLGPDDAERFLGTVVGRPGTVAASLLPRPARANRPIFYAKGRKGPKGLSVAAVHRKFEEMMGSRTSRYQDVGGVPGALAYAEAVVR